MNWWCLSIELAPFDMTVVGSLGQLNMMFEGVSFGGEALVPSIDCGYSPSTFVIILHSLRFKCIKLCTFR